MNFCGVLKYVVMLCRFGLSKLHNISNLQVDDKYDINLSTSWKGENGEKEPSLEKAYGKVQRKTDRVSIPGPGTFSLMLDNSYSWLNTKVVKLSFVTV